MKEYLSAAQKMRVGPSESAYRSGFQIASQRITPNGVYGKPARKRRFRAVR